MRQVGLVRAALAGVVGILLAAGPAGAAPPARPGQVSQADSDRARDLNNEAAALHNAGQHRLALALYGRVISLNPYAAVYYNNRAAARDQVNDLAGALADYDVALRIDPKPAVFYSNRAAVLMKRNDIDHALSDYDRAVKAEPQTGFFHQERAKALLRKGDAPAAVAEFRRAYQLDPKLAHAREMARALESAPPPPPPESNPDAPRKAEAGDGRRIALVIGNARYSAVPALDNPGRDAAAMTGALKAVGFDVESVADADRQTLLAALDRFGDRAADAAWAVVYYAGHGMEAAGVNYLLPVDLRLKDDAELQNQAVALDRVLSSVQRARKLGLVILDACRDFPLKDAVKRTIATRAVERGLARPSLPAAAGTLVAFATEQGQVSLDGAAGGNSPFTGALARRLGTRGLEVDRLFRTVRDDVLAATGERQRPYVYGSIPSESLFFRP